MRASPPFDNRITNYGSFSYQPVEQSPRPKQDKWINYPATSSCQYPRQHSVYLSLPVSTPLRVSPPYLSPISRSPSYDVVAWGGLLNKGVAFDWSVYNLPSRIRGASWLNVIEGQPLLLPFSACDLKWPPGGGIQLVIYLHGICPQANGEEEPGLEDVLVFRCNLSTVNFTGPGAGNLFPLPRSMRGNASRTS